MAVIGGALIATGVLGAPAHAGSEVVARPTVPGPVVVLGVAGLRWSDISADTPTLEALLANGAVANLVARSVADASCPVDGWLGLSAGRRADAARAPDGACEAPDAARWGQYRARTSTTRFGAVLGTLADAVATAGRRTTAIGPGAVVALTRSDGTTPSSLPIGPGTGVVDTGTVVASLRSAIAHADLVLADLGVVATTTADAATPGDRGVITRRSEQVAALEEVLKAAVEALPAQATVLVTSLADAAPGPALQLTAVVGRTVDGQFVPPSLLRSGSTRQDGLITTADLTATTLTWLGATVADRVDGAPLTVTQGGTPDADRLQSLLDLDQRAAVIHRDTVVFLLPLSAALLAIFAWWVALARRRALLPRSSARDRPVRALELAGVFFGAAPAATVASAALPWWRAGAAGTALVGAVTLIMALVAATALLGPWRRHRLGPATVVAAVTVAVLVGDVAAGSPWSVITLLGGDPLQGARFYGFGNQLAGVLAAGGLILALVAADGLLRRGRPDAAGSAVIAIGAVAAVVDVLPALGADVGGAPALLPGFAAMALQVSGRRITLRRALAALTAVGLLLLTVAFLDWRRPPAQRTHLGRFVQTVLDGGGGDVIGRKLAVGLGQFTSAWYLLLAPVTLGLIAWTLARPEKAGLSLLDNAYRAIPTLKPAVIGAGVVAVLGFLANDTGLSIPLAEAFIGLPLLIAVSARVELATPPSRPPSPRR